LPDADQIRRHLETHVWPHLPPGASVPYTKEQVEEILGFGPDGV
jgi:hypothetical protein